MAIDSSVYSRNQFRMGIARQTTWGTALTDDAGAIPVNFVELFTTDVVEPDLSGLIRDETKRTDGKMVKSHTDVFVTTAGAEYTISVSGICTRGQLDMLLFGVMQDLTSEGAISPFVKVWEWDGATTGISGGLPICFFTIRTYAPAGSTYGSRMYKDCVLKSLTLSHDPSSNGGRMTFKADFWTGSTPTLTGLTVAPASWTGVDNVFYRWNDLSTKALGGTTNNLVVNKWSMTFDNSCTRVGGSLTTDNAPEAVFFPEFKLTGSIDVKLDATTKSEITKWQTTPDGGSADQTLYLEYYAATATHNLKLDMNVIYTGPPAADYGNAAGVFLSLPFEGVDDGTNEVIEVTMANQIDRTW